MIMGAEVGMLIVETIAKILRAFFVQGKSIKAILLPQRGTETSAMSNL
jgi:hypothetical protein